MAYTLTITVNNSGFTAVIAQEADLH